MKFYKAMWTTCCLFTPYYDKHIHAPTYTHVHLYITCVLHIQTHMGTTHTYLHTCALHTHTYTHVHYMHAYLHAHMCTYTHEHLHICVPTHIYTQSTHNLHTHLHTHLHTRMHTSTCNPPPPNTQGVNYGFGYV